MDQAGVHVDDLHCAGILGWPGWPTGHLTTASAYPGGGQCSQYTTAHPVTGTSIFKITAFIFIIKLIILQLPTGHISDISKVANTNSAKKWPMHANGGKVLDSIGFVRPDDHQRDWIRPANKSYKAQAIFLGPSPKEGCFRGCVTRWMSSLPKKIGLMNLKGKHYHNMILKPFKE